MDKHTASTGPEKQSPIQMQKQPSAKDTTSFSFSRSIYDLTLANFESCLLNGNLSALVISGFPSPADLAKAWEDIMQEYTEALGDNDYKMYVSLYRECEMLRIDYESVRIAVESEVLDSNGKRIRAGALRLIWSEYIASEVSKILRTPIKYTPNDTKAYMSQLDKCERRSKGLKLQLDMKLLELESIKSKFAEKAGNKELDRNYFTSILIILSRHNHYPITKSIFVNEYCEHIKQYSAYCDKINEQNRAASKRK